MGNLCSSGKLDNCEENIIYSKYTCIVRQINGICTHLFPIWPWCGCIHGYSFRNGSWLKQSIIVPKDKQINLCTQARNCKLVWSSKTGLERREYYQDQVDPCVFYRKNLVILTYVDCVIVSHKQEKITSLIESLNNFSKIICW